MSKLGNSQVFVNTGRVLCCEGFARVIRAGLSDIYVLQNQEYPGDHKVSLAFYMDNFEQDSDYKIYGEPLILCEDDQIEFLGRVEEYFIPRALRLIDRFQIVRMNPIEIGLLLSVRAIEHLQIKLVQNDEREMLAMVKYYRDGYYRRRLVLST